MSAMTITVTGMTCGHCASAVREEIGAIEGVTAVTVDLSSGTVSIESDRVLDDAAVHAAVQEAGYALADAG